ncbi:hypothetical protein J1P26_25135, partial [Neobacillus sp. MM2021_6]
IIIISSFVGLKITEYFLVWLMGAIIPLVKPIMFKSNFVKYLILFISIILVIASMKAYMFFGNHPKLQIVPDLSIGITFSILLYLIVSFFNYEIGENIINIPKQLAAFSYTLYLTHFPLAHIIFTWRASTLWTFDGKEAMFIKLIIMVSVVLYAWIISSLTEKHTEKVRKAIFGFIKALNVKKVKSIIVK